MPKPLDILLPPSGKGPGVLVIHPWWGLNATIRKYGAALAKEGFVVGLTDLYDGEIATTIDEAMALRRANQGKPHKDRVRRNLAELLAQPAVTSKGIGLVGFSMGGFLALGMAKAPPCPIPAIVTYYATRNVDFAASDSAFLLHFAETDDYESAAAAKRMQAALPGHAHIYPDTRHWFAESDRPEYDTAAATLAFDRTVTHLRKAMG